MTIEYWIGTGMPINLPAGQRDTRRKWKGSVMYLDEDNLVTEYAIKAKNKVKLSTFLEAIKENLLHLEPNDFDVVDCGFKVE